MVHSAQWSKVWVDRPDLVIFETEDLITFSGLFGASPKRVSTSRPNDVWWSSN